MGSKGKIPKLKFDSIAKASWIGSKNFKNNIADYVVSKIEIGKTKKIKALLMFSFRLYAKMYEDGRQHTESNIAGKLAGKKLYVILLYIKY